MLFKKYLLVTEKKKTKKRKKRTSKKEKGLAYHSGAFPGGLRRSKWVWGAWGSNTGNNFGSEYIGDNDGIGDAGGGDSGGGDGGGGGE